MTGLGRTRALLCRHRVHDLARLAHKYRTLSELRAARVPRAAAVPLLCALAREFPGALRELDALPSGIIAARLRAIEAALAGGAAEPWMGWQIAYHDELARALVTKRRLAGERAPSDERCLELASPDRDAAWVRAVASPPGGRLSRSVVARVAARLGVPAAELARAVSPALAHAPSELAGE